MSNRSLFRTRIKFCGLTRAGDVRLSGELGVDAVGFVFARNSPRRVDPRDARTLRNALAPLVDAVALFMDNALAEVRDAVTHVRPTLLQFHGREDDAFCRSFGIPYIKAIAMQGEEGAMDGRDLHLRYPHAAGFVFDGHATGEPGGSGKTFDWSRIPANLLKPYVLAGGLDAGNVFEAIHATQPWGVDVCSGIEQAPGIKDGDRMRAFVEAVRRADCVELKKDSDDICICHACGR